MKEFECYVAQVIKNIPIFQRRNVRQDLMSDLLEELHEAKQRDSEATSDVLVAAILQRRQQPSVVSSSYRKEIVGLIDAQAYPIYQFTLKIALVISMVCIVATLLALGNTVVIDVLGRIGVSLAIVFSLVTANFYVLSRLGWEPSRLAMGLLKELVYGKQKSMQSRNALKVVFVSLALLVLLLWPQSIGLPIFIVTPEQSVGIYPVLSNWFLGWPRIALAVWLAFCVVLAALRVIRPSATPTILAEISQAVGIVVTVTIMFSGDVFATPSPQEITWLPGEKTDILASLMPRLIIVLNTVVWSVILLRLLHTLQWALREMRTR